MIAVTAVAFRQAEFTGRFGSDGRHERLVPRRSARLRFLRVAVEQSRRGDSNP